MSHFDSSQLTLILFAHMTLNYCTGSRMTGVTCYISLYVGAKRLVFYLSPRDGHVIIVSGCLILTAVNLIILVRMGNIIDRLVSRCARSTVTFDICLHELCVRVSVRHVITKFSQMDSLPNFVTHGARLGALRARKSSANNNHSHGGRKHTRVLLRFLLCSMVSGLLLEINHLQIDGEGYRVCEEASGGI